MKAQTVPDTRGLVPGIHVLNANKIKDVDGRDIPGTKCPGTAMTNHAERASAPSIMAIVFSRP